MEATNGKCDRCNEALDTLKKGARSVTCAGCKTIYYDGTEKRQTFFEQMAYSSKAESRKKLRADVNEFLLARLPSETTIQEMDVLANNIVNTMMQLIKCHKEEVIQPIGKGSDRVEVVDH